MSGASLPNVRTLGWQGALPPRPPQRRYGGAAPAETPPSMRPSPGCVPGAIRSAGRSLAFGSARSATEVNPLRGSSTCVSAFGDWRGRPCGKLLRASRKGWPAFQARRSATLARRSVVASHLPGRIAPVLNFPVGKHGATRWTAASDGRVRAGRRPGRRRKSSVRYSPLTASALLLFAGRRPGSVVKPLRPAGGWLYAIGWRGPPAGPRVWIRATGIVYLEIPEASESTAGQVDGRTKSAGVLIGVRGAK